MTSAPLCMRHRVVSAEPLIGGMKMELLIIGGDMRCAHLARLMDRRGMDVRALDWKRRWSLWISAQARTPWRMRNARY